MKHVFHQVRNAVALGIAGLRLVEQAGVVGDPAEVASDRPRLNCPVMKPIPVFRITVRYVPEAGEKPSAKSAVSPVASNAGKLAGRSVTEV